MHKYLGKLVVGSLIAAYILGGALGVFAAWDMSEPTQVAFVILLIGATLWITEAVPLFVTSLVILFLGLVWLLDVIRADGSELSATVYLAPFFSDIILLFLGGFTL